MEAHHLCGLERAGPGADVGLVEADVGLHTRAGRDRGGGRVLPWEPCFRHLCLSANSSCN